MFNLCTSSYLETEPSTSQCQSVLSRLQDESRQVKASPRDSDEASSSVDTPDASNLGELLDGESSQSRDADSLSRVGQDSEMPDVTLSFGSHDFQSHGEHQSHYSHGLDSSVFSDTFRSPPYRSRIPLPVAGSYHSNHMVITIDTV